MLEATTLYSEDLNHGQRYARRRRRARPARQRAQRHSRTGLDVRPELYGAWLECLSNAARGHDPAFSIDVESAWRQALGPGIGHLRSAY